MERNVGRAVALDMDYLTKLVAHNVAIKARVVAADPFEKGERAHLNLGHTYGHAIESESKYSYSHGQSIALGMVAAAYTAEKLGLIDAEQKRRMMNLISKAGLPTSGLTVDVNAVVDAMAFDKKVKSGKVRLVLPEGIGNAVIRDNVSMEQMREAVQSLKG
jgi:3-dehydroquinate synthase